MVLVSLGVPELTLLLRILSLQDSWIKIPTMNREYHAHTRSYETEHQNMPEKTSTEPRRVILRSYRSTAV